jgi:hypothetical protein
MPSPALIVATAALFVALGGTSYAVSKLPKNSVSTEQVKDRSLLAADFKSSELRKLQGPGGPQGPAGAVGPQGAAGATGSAGASGAPGESGVRTVIDGNGDVVGELAGLEWASNTGLSLLVKIGSYYWYVGQDGKPYMNDSGLIYPNSTCSGTPSYTTNSVSGPGAIAPRATNAPGGVFVEPVGSTWRAWESPNWHQSTWPSGTTITYRINGGVCQAPDTTMNTWHVIDDLVPVTVPTLIPPLTIAD